MQYLGPTRLRRLVALVLMLAIPLFVSALVTGAHASALVFSALISLVFLAVSAPLRLFTRQRAEDPNLQEAPLLTPRFERPPPFKA